MCLDFVILWFKRDRVKPKWQFLQGECCHKRLLPGDAKMAFLVGDGSAEMAVV